MCGCGKDCLILIPFRLPETSSFTLSLKYFSSDSDICTDMGIGPWLQFPHLLRAGPVLLTLLFFFPQFLYPTEFCMVLYILFSHGSACTSVSEGLFLMYLWRELCSMSTYSSAFFFPSQVLGVFLKHINFGEKNDKIR